MPHLRIAGMSRDDVQHLSESLLSPLAQLVQCPEDHFTFEFLNNAFIFNGQWGANAYPMIDLLWFERPQATQNAVAQLITEQVRALVGDGLDICVRVWPLQATAYYENGQHF